MTGDIGYLSADGHLFVIDRLVDIGYRNGAVISPSELERKLEVQPPVAEAGVVLAPVNDSPALSVVAFVVLHETTIPVAKSAVGRADLQHLNECDEVYFIDRLPRLPVNGKVGRKTLLANLATVRATQAGKKDVIKLDTISRK